jgi:hypothetical protein
MPGRRPGCTRSAQKDIRRAGDHGRLVIAAILLVAGGLLLWGNNFVTDKVHTARRPEDLLPAGGQPGNQGAALHRRQGHDGLRGPVDDHRCIGPDVRRPLIAVHLVKIGGGKTYSQLATTSLAQPNNAALAAQVQTVFRGETLRGLLLNAYGFWQMGQIMLIAGIAAFTAAGLMLILSSLGIAHLRHTAPESEVLPKLATRVEVNTT